MQAPDIETSWLIEPFFPREGVVLIHGKKSIGKSPFIWSLMQSVSEGESFFGYDVQTPGWVIYIELDTSRNLLKPRLRKLANPVIRHMEMVFYRSLDSLNLHPDTVAFLKDLNEKRHPVLVVINTLRRVHQADGNKGEIPSQVYKTWEGLFPSSCIAFVHHDKKSSRKPSGVIVEPGDEDFSGSLAWANDAQVVLHLINGTKPRQVRLKITGSQVGSMTEELRLELGADGTNFISAGDITLSAAYNALDPALPKLQRYDLVADSHLSSRSTVQRAVRNASCCRLVKR